MDSNQQQPAGLDPVESQVKAHWQKYRPRMSALLDQRNQLDYSVRKAADLMRESQADLVAKGMDYQQALEKSRPIAFLPDEEDVPELPNNPLLPLPTTTE